MSLGARLLKVAAKSVEGSAIVNKSKILEDALKPICSLPIPALNLALGGSFREGKGGLFSGCMQLVGDSRCFKSMYGLMMVKAYLDEYPEAVCVFIDTERGASLEYFESLGIDQERVIHVPCDSIENMKIVSTQLLDGVQKGEKAIFFVDSLGLVASKKEVGDAMEGKDTTDMTRARALNSFWRCVMSPINNKNLFLVAVNHYYDSIGGMFPEKIIKGGKNGFLASNDIWMISRSKLKDGKELAGYSFNIGIVKSRKLKEGARIPVEVYYDGGIDKYSGLLEMARATGHIESPKNGWYTRTFVEGDKNWRKAEMNAEFYESLLADDGFNDAIESAYKLNAGSGKFDLSIADYVEEMVAGVDYDPETGEIYNED